MPMYDHKIQQLGVITASCTTPSTNWATPTSCKGTVEQLPDAQSRLSYIARLTGEAAEKVLNHVDGAKAEHDFIAAATSAGWSTRLVASPACRAVAKGHARTAWTGRRSVVTKEADTHLTEIMMAQDFHDLTGQVIARVVHLAATIEEQLVQLLMQTAPPNAQVAADEAYEMFTSAGPVVDPENTPDVVTDQSHVDDLLASLGF